MPEKPVGTLMADKIISRADAKAAGLKRFFSGRPCKRGHVGEFYVNNGGCVECALARSYAWYEANTERAKANVHANYAANRQRIIDYNKAYAAANRHVNNAATARYRIKHSEECKARRRAYKAAHREKIRAAARAYAKANKERIKATAQAWRKANPERYAMLAAAWKKANPEKTKATWLRSRSKRVMAEGSHTAEDLKRIYNAQCGMCAYCKAELGRKYHVDHIQPLSKGGTNWPANLQILCAPCNLKKGARDPVEHARSLGLLL